MYGGATSLDNFRARSNHQVDWLLWSDEVAEVSAASWARFDTVLMGRKTYEVAAGMGQPNGYPGVANYLFSTTLETSPSDNVTLVRDDAVTFVRQLKAQPGRDICLVGGGDFARTLFVADLIDEVGINVHPVLLGSGIPAFHNLPKQVDLELANVRQFRTGCVLLTYRVRRAR